MTHVAKFAPSLGPCYHLPPPEPKPRLPDPPSTEPAPWLGVQPLPFPDPLPWNQGPWSTPPSTRPAPVGTPPTRQGILQKKPFFFFLYALETTNTTHVAKFAPSLGPVPLPPTPPEPKPLHPPPSPCPASLTPRPPLCGWVLFLPSQPFPDPFPWNQGPWSTPPSTRPAPVGTPPTPQGILQKKPFFFFLYALEKYDTRCEVCSVPGARAPTTYPPGTEALAPSPEPLPRLPDPPSTKPHTLRNLLRPSLPPTPPEPKPLHPPTEPLPRLPDPPSTKPALWVGALSAKPTLP